MRHKPVELDVEVAVALMLLAAPNSDPDELPKSPVPNAGGAVAVVVVVGAVVVGAPNRLDSVGVELLLVVGVVVVVGVAAEPNRPVPLVLEPGNIIRSLSLQSAKTPAGKIVPQT